MLVLVVSALAHTVQGLAWHSWMRHRGDRYRAGGVSAVRADAQRDPQATPDVVLRTLVGAAAGKNSVDRGTSREESVRIGGRVPLKVGSGRNRIVLKLQHVDEATQKQLREELKDWAEAWLRRKLEGT